MKPDRDSWWISPWSLMMYVKHGTDSSWHVVIKLYCNLIYDQSIINNDLYNGKAIGGHAWPRMASSVFCTGKGTNCTAMADPCIRGGRIMAPALVRVAWSARHSVDLDSATTMGRFGIYGTVDTLWMTSLWIKRRMFMDIAIVLMTHSTCIGNLTSSILESQSTSSVAMRTRSPPNQVGQSMVFGLARG